MTSPLPQSSQDDDAVRLEQAYKKLIEELELHQKKGKLLKEEVEQTINHEQIQIVLNKIKNIKAE